jgi:HlyD family secretion protein
MTEEATFSAKRPIVRGMVVLAILLAILGGWGVATQLDGAVIASGQVQVESNRQVVQHPDGGVISSIDITEGQTVTAGDVLLTLDGSLLLSERTIIATQLSETRARRARLQAERDDSPSLAFPDDLLALAQTDPSVAEQISGQRRLFEARRDTLARQSEQLAKRRAQVESQIEGIDAQAAALDLQNRLIEEERADQQSLFDRGLAQSARLLGLTREAASLQGRIGELAAQRAQAEGRMTEIDLEALRLAALRREEATAELREIDPVERELAERYNALTERIDRLTIRAPVSGTVLSLSVTTPRAVIRPAEPILYLVPQDRPLVISIRIPPLHVDEVQVGQPVRLIFSALVTRNLPDITGTLSRVSADALTDPNTGAPFFLAEVTLSPEAIALLGDQQLLPGMPVEAFLPTGSRSPMAYLLKPFTDYFLHAFRES